MSRFEKIPRWLIILLAAISMSGLQSCGDSITAPSTATITITPSSVEFANLPDPTVSDFKVLVQYSDGTPMPHAKVNITGSFAVPWSSAVYQFYYYPLGPARPGGNTKVDSGFDAQTNEFGVYEFSVEIFPGIAFNDTIHVTSGAVTQSADIVLTYD